jgi:hypothetical protein
MQMGVDTVFAKKPLSAGTKLVKLTDAPKPAGAVDGTSNAFGFEYRGADSAIAINRLLKAGARITLALSSSARKEWTYTLFYGVPQSSVEGIARETGIQMFAHQRVDPAIGFNQNNWPLKLPMPSTARTLVAPRIGLYQSWTANMDEGWTRWVLEHYEFPYTTLHNSDIKEHPGNSSASAGLSSKLRERFDVIILPDQQPRDILNGFDFKSVREE